jgi:hypothetical protein
MIRMKHLILASVLITCTAHGQSFDAAIENCSDFQYQQYTVCPYISAAIQLQNMGRESAISVLRECCEKEENQNRVIILCRMLFESEGEMRRPFIGGAAFMGNSTYDDWPSEPIEIVQNIPFLIVRGYSLGGVPERAIDYLEYCELHCTWRNEIFGMPSEDYLLASLNELLNSEKWQTPLTDEEEEFFRFQIGTGCSKPLN